MVEPAEELNSRDEVEAIRRIIRAVLAEEKEAARAEHGATGGLLDVIKTNWPVIVGLVTVGLSLAAWLRLGVSPLDNMREIAQRKQQHKYQQELARRHVEGKVDAMLQSVVNVQTAYAKALMIDRERLAACQADGDVLVLDFRRTALDWRKRHGDGRNVGLMSSYSRNQGTHMRWLFWGPCIQGSTDKRHWSTMTRR